MTPAQAPPRAVFVVGRVVDGWALSSFYPPQPDPALYGACKRTRDGGAAALRGVLEALARCSAFTWRPLHLPSDPRPGGRALVTGEQALIHPRLALQIRDRPEGSAVLVLQQKGYTASLGAAATRAEARQQAAAWLTRQHAALINVVVVSDFDRFRTAEAPPEEDDIRERFLLVN